MNILAIGDVIGKPGRQALARVLPSLKKEFAIDLTVVNAENSAGGIGVTQETAIELLKNGADALTSGNHVWMHKDVFPLLDDNTPIVRPLNYPPGVFGKGYVEVKGVLVVNLIGRTFMGAFDDPFRTMDTLLSDLIPRPRITFVDFHAEATSEKVAMGRYLDGRVSAVLGTHTHVGTIDASVLPKGTAYVTDIGMTGPIDSIIGDDPDEVLARFLTQLPHRLSVGKGKCVVNAILVKVDDHSGRATGIERIQRVTD